LTDASLLPFQIGRLVEANQLTIAGSSTLTPIALEEATQFPIYWNSLAAANPGWGTVSALEINQVNIGALGSGNAIPALAASTTDVGELSIPPSDIEWQTSNMGSLQQWSVGIDSMAIILSPDLTWFPNNLNTLQVAQLFADTNPTANTAGTGIPLYNTGGDFLAAYYGGANNIPSAINGVQITAAIKSEVIQRAIRDPTSGIFDCFNNFFAVPNGYQFEHASGSPGTVTATENMAPYTLSEEDSNFLVRISEGSLSSGSDYIGLVPVGSLPYGNVIPLNISFNLANPPSSTIMYSGHFGTVGQQNYSWGPYVAPTVANVEYAYSNVQTNFATGQFDAWRWLWEVTPGPIPASGPPLAAGVWIAYLRAHNPTALPRGSTPAQALSWVTINVSS